MKAARVGKSVESVQDPEAFRPGAFSEDFGNDRYRLAKLRSTFIEKKKESEAMKNTNSASKRGFKPALTIRPEESLRAFGKRVRAATQPLLSELMGEAKVPRLKRKEHLAARKKAKKLKRRGMRHEAEEEKLERALRVDRVAFQDHVQEPPKLTAKPKPVLKWTPSPGPTGTVKKSLKEQEDIERLRQTAIEYYRSKKQEKRQASSQAHE